MVPPAWLLLTLLLCSVWFGCDRTSSTVSVAGGEPGSSGRAEATQAVAGPTGHADSGPGQGRAVPRLAADAAGTKPGPRTQATDVEYVMLISVDGLAPRFVDQMIAAGQLPTFRALQQQAAWTHNARSDFTHTVTLPNHITILTGRPVSAAQGLPATAHHGYAKNVLPARRETLHNAGNPALDYVASVFDVVHDFGKRTCLYAGKDKFVIFDQSYDEQDGAVDRIGEDNGRDKLDVSVLDGDTARLVDALLAEQRVAPCNFVFLLIADTDGGGHRHGWGSAAWQQILQRADEWIGRIWRLLKTEPRLRGHSALILVADHGGHGNSHHNASDPFNYTVPFYVWAPGIPAGKNLYSLVADTRRDPGQARPSYAQSPPPIRNGDAANLALELLGLPPIPGSVLRGIGLVERLNPAP
jgi:hypothetical protein